MNKGNIVIWTCWVCTYKNYQYKLQTATYNKCEECGTPENTTSTFQVETCRNTDTWLRIKDE